MSTQGQQVQPASPIYRTERVIASLVMAWVIILTTYMIFQDHELSQSSMYFLKIILSLSGAVMLATLPGFLDINYNIGGFSVRAAGGAAAFVFIYTQSPNLPVLKLDPARARPAQNQPAPKTDTVSALTSGFPTLMAFSLMAPGVTYSSAGAGGAFVQSGDSGVGVILDPPQDGALVTGSLGGGGIGFGEAVSADARAALATVAAYARSAARALRGLLNRMAAALREGVSWAAEAVGKVAGAVQTLLGAPRQTIDLISETVSARADALLSDVLGPEGASVGALINQSGGLTTGLLGGLGQSVDAIVTTTDGTVQALASALHGTAHSLLDSTETLAHGLTGTLGRATGDLAPAANRIVSGISSATGQVVDGVTPVVTNATSRVLKSVGDGAGKLTERLNAVSPELISRLDPHFVASQMPLQLPDRLETANLLPGIEKIADPFAKMGRDNRQILFGGAGERALLPNRFADPLGGEALHTGARCIAGCGGGLVSSADALRDTADGLGLRQGGLLNPLNGGGSASGGPASFGDGPATAAGLTGNTPQGAVSSALGSTRSLLGGAARLGRH